MIQWVKYNGQKVQVNSKKKSKEVNKLRNRFLPVLSKLVYCCFSVLIGFSVSNFTRWTSNCHILFTNHHIVKTHKTTATTSLQASSMMFSLHKPLIRSRKFNDEEHEFIITVLESSTSFLGIPKSSSLKGEALIYDEIANAFDHITCAENAVIMEQGDTKCEYMYLVESGEVNVTVDGKKLPEPYGTLKRGSTFGESSWIYQKPRSATICTTQTTKLFRLDRASFEMFFGRIQGSKSSSKKDDIAKLKRIDEVLNEISGVTTKYKGDVLAQYKPRRFWLYRQWRGTVIQHAWKLSILNMLLTAGIVLFTYWNEVSESMFDAIQNFSMYWNYLVSLTTLTLIFFLFGAFSFWRKFYMLTRKVQGRMNDISLLLTSVARRQSGEVDKDGIDNSGYHPGAKALLDEVGHYLRVYHIFLWADHANRYKILLTKEGMDRMVIRGMMSKKQYSVVTLIDPTLREYHWIILEWITSRIGKGFNDGSLIDRDGSPTWSAILVKIGLLRRFSAKVGYELHGRMPSAYVHLVQFQVDTLIFGAPFALFPSMGNWSILCVGVITLFFAGLLGLCKLFLDPLNNDNYLKDSVSIDIGALIRQSNQDSTRWFQGARILPFNYHEKVEGDSYRVNENITFMQYETNDRSYRDNDLDSLGGVSC